MLKPVFYSFKSQDPLNWPKNIGDCIPSLDGSIGTTLNPHPPPPLFWPYNILKQKQRNTKKIEKVEEIYQVEKKQV
jgi:hypothetical protein